MGAQDQVLFEVTPRQSVCRACMTSCVQKSNQFLGQKCACFAPNISLGEMLQQFPEALTLVAMFDDDPETSLRRYRELSCSFERSFALEPAQSSSKRHLTRIVGACNTLFRSDRSRSARLLLFGIWLVLIGVVCPMLITCWSTQSLSAAAHGEQSYDHRMQLLLLVATALVAALCSPAPQAQSGEIWDAVELLGIERGEQTVIFTDSSAPTELEEAKSSILSSASFVVALKRRMSACSVVGILITQCPLLGSLVACVSLLVSVVSQMGTVHLDAKVNVLHMMQGNRDSLLAMPGLSPTSEIAVLTDPFKCPDLQAGALRTLTLTAVLLCAARSMALWVSDLQGCGLVKQDLHDPACLSSLTTMLCPGFLTCGCLLQSVVSYVGCASELQVDGNPFCYAATCTYFWTPPVCLYFLGGVSMTKFLADASHSQLSEVLSFWRLPMWEECVCLCALASLWMALFFASALIMACFRILRCTNWPIFIGIYAACTLVLEAILALSSFPRGERFLPRIFLLTSSVSTSVLGLLCVAVVLYSAAEYTLLRTSPKERPLVGYGYLWG